MRHLDEEEKRRLVVNTPPYQIRAWTEGEPALGVGAIYPIDEVDIIVPDRSIPDSWPRVYGMDVCWNLGQGEPASHLRQFAVGAIGYRGNRPGRPREFPDRRAYVDAAIRTAWAASWTCGECGGSGNHRSMGLARVGPAQGDGEFIELAPGVSEIPPRRQGFGRNRQTGRPSDGLDSISDRERPPPNVYQAIPPAPAQTLALRGLALVLGRYYCVSSLVGRRLDLEGSRIVTAQSLDSQNNLQCRAPPTKPRLLLNRPVSYR